MLSYLKQRNHLDMIFLRPFNPQRTFIYNTTIVDRRFHFQPGPAHTISGGDINNRYTLALCLYVFAYVRTRTACRLPWHVRCSCSVESDPRVDVLPADGAQGQVLSAIVARLENFKKKNPICDQNFPTKSGLFFLGRSS